MHGGLITEQGKRRFLLTAAAPCTGAAVAPRRKGRSSETPKGAERPMGWQSRTSGRQGWPCSVLRALCPMAGLGCAFFQRSVGPPPVHPLPRTPALPSLPAQLRPSLFSFRFLRSSWVPGPQHRGSSSSREDGRSEELASMRRAVPARAELLALCFFLAACADQTQAGPG